jgi:hypothetical protein
MNRRSAARGATRTALVAAGIAAAGALVVVIVALDPTRGRPRETRPAEPRDVIELVPGQPSPQELAEGSARRSDLNRLPSLGVGGGIQIADAQGRLAQQYQFDDLDPNPPGMPAEWARMTGLRAEIYGSGNRVLALRGASALVHVPRGVLDSGTLSGGVVIRIHEVSDGGILDEARDRAILEVRTDEAQYDDFIGAVRCRGRFEAESIWGEMAGWGLTILLDESRRRHELRIERLQGEARLVAPPRDPQSPADAAPGASAAQAAASAPGDAAAQPHVSPADGTGTAAQAPHAADRLYMLTLRDRVRLRQGDESSGRVATGERLSILFRAERRFLGGTGANDVPGPAVPGAPPSAHPPAPTDSAPSAGISPPPRPDDVYVSCMGSLAVVPVDEPSPEPPRASDARLELSGSPLHLIDHERRAEVSCAALAYDPAQERLELTGSPDHPIVVSSPQLHARGEAFELDVADGLGAFVGPGRIEVDAPEAVDGGERLRVAWVHRLDLELQRPQAAGGGGALRRCEFRGDVHAARGALRMRADLVTVDFRRIDETSAAGSDPGGARVELDRFEGLEDVRVVLPQGGLAWAQRLRGDALGRSVELLGADVTFALGTWLVDGGSRVLAEEGGGTVRWEGPGRARLYSTALASGDPSSPPPRPQPAQPPELTITWMDSMRYEGAGPAGTIDLEGSVEALWARDAAEEGALRCASMALRLAPAEGTEPGTTGIADRSVEQVLARGQVRLESRHWETAERRGEPRLLYVGGDELHHDPRSGEVLVPGPGDLLLHDPGSAQDPPPAASVAAGAGEGSILRRGTTSFRWTRQLRLSRIDQRTMRVAMTGEVEMRHLDLAGAPATLAAAALQADLDRVGEEGGSPVPGGAAAPASVIDGPLRLARLEATGEVFLRTPRRDVDCDELVYDPITGVARLRARPGRLVTIFARDRPEPLRLREAEWDLTTDAVSVTGASG